MALGCGVWSCGDLILWRPWPHNTPYRASHSARISAPHRALDSPKISALYNALPKTP